MAHARDPRPPGRHDGRDDGHADGAAAPRERRRDQRGHLRQLVAELGDQVSAMPIGQRRDPSPPRGPRAAHPELGLPDPERPDPPRAALDETYWAGEITLPRRLDPVAYPRLLTAPPPINRRDPDWEWPESPTHLAWILYFWEAIQRLWTSYHASIECLRGVVQLARPAGLGGARPSCTFFFRSPYLTAELLEELARRASASVCRYAGIRPETCPLDMYVQGRRYQPVPGPWVEENILTGPHWEVWWAICNVFPWSEIILSRRGRAALQDRIARDRVVHPAARMPRAPVHRQTDRQAAVAALQHLPDPAIGLEDSEDEDGDPAAGPGPAPRPHPHHPHP